VAIFLSFPLHSFLFFFHVCYLCWHEHEWLNSSWVEGYFKALNMFKLYQWRLDSDSLNSSNKFCFSMLHKNEFLCVCLGAQLDEHDRVWMLELDG
jgi:hypothetical protein